MERAKAVFSKSYVSREDAEKTAMARDVALKEVEQLKGRVRGLEQGIRAVSEQARAIARKAKLSASLPEEPCFMRISGTTSKARGLRFSGKCDRIGVHDEHHFIVHEDGWPEEEDPDPGEVELRLPGC